MASVWRAVIVLVLVGCAQESEDAIPEERSGSSAPSGDSGSEDRGEVDFHFSPVEAVLSCEQGPEGTPDQEGELCYQLGPETVGAEVVESADVESDEIGGWRVALVLTESGIDRFNVLTSECNPPSEVCPTGQVAIVLDDEVLSAPTIQQPAFERDQIVITGEFPQDEADDIAQVLDG